MKNIIVIIITLFITLSYSCDTIEGDYIDESAPFITDVILFEFTGIHCPNCPDGHRIVEDLHNRFGEKFHAISIHAGGFADPWGSGEPDFRTEEGNVIHDFIKPEEYPSGAVMNLNEGSAISKTSWATELGRFGWARSDVYIDYTMEIKDTVLTSNITLTIEDDIEGEFYLCIYIIEDGIIGFQQDHGEAKNEYEHNHVFRGSMNGALGTIVNIGIEIEKKFTITIKEDWNKNNLHIIPFVYNKQTLMVLPSLITKFD